MSHECRWEGRILWVLDYGLCLGVFGFRALSPGLSLGLETSGLGLGPKP